MTTSHITTGVPLPRQRTATADGLITVVCNTEDLEFYVDAHVGYAPGVLFDVMVHLHNLGLEALDDDIDGAPERLADGTIRTWFSPLDARVDLMEDSLRTEAWIAELKARMEEMPCSLLK